MARLVADENFPQPVVVVLRALGHDVITLEELGKAQLGLSDEFILELATTDRRAVLTINRRHFFALHRRSPDHAGVIACTLDLDFAGQAQRVHDEITHLVSLERLLIRVNRPNRSSEVKRDDPMSDEENEE